MPASTDRSSPAELVGRCTFPDPGTAIDCAVSGGADSLALLALAVEAGCTVTAIHVDHGLRDGSEHEAEVVAVAARSLGASFRAEKVHVGHGPNLEARARAARYEVLPPDVHTGHTADDQAETVLLNLMRGAGLRGLAGIHPTNRPLLSLRRRETAELCRTLGWQPVEDPMNTDPRFSRVRVRHELITLLNDIAGRDIVPVLCRQTVHLREVVDLVSVLASEIEPTDAPVVAAADPPVRAESLQRWLQAETGSEHPVDSAAIARVVDVALGHVEATEIAGGHRVTRSQQRLRVEHANRHSEL